MAGDKAEGAFEARWIGVRHGVVWRRRRGRDPALAPRATLVQLSATTPY